ncbi:tetratricopeptide repeat protein [Streptomyces sp. A2-16]|uniref:tetratricopeptide repeat protein n=1 Tax=Streptomyces sp. A2-16 TaxID=2781734 RepID=UPI001BB06E12|nr:tetratricopeptide repeat protein [Streptomyces sp. A2-16]QUC56037.1 tetratricopeptide repeat protein [Streptomyces sp. A2-16]
MDERRVVCVAGPAVGSGYVIGPRLVLASAHCTPAVGGDVVVQLPRHEPPREYRAKAVWRGTPEKADDAALLYITDEAWVPVSGVPLRWGRLVTDTPGVACESWGYPQVVQRQGSPELSWHPFGRVTAAPRAGGGRYVMQVGGQSPEQLEDDASPWGGISGAALFCGDLLAAVLAVAPRGWRHSQLEAVPVHVLLADPEFRQALREGGYGALPRLEPVEWQHLAESAYSGPAKSPAALLRADRQVVSFHGRQALLQELDDWCARVGFDVRLITGPAGQGKTRLAYELAARLEAAGWTTLWLRSTADGGDIAALKDASVPLLLVVDYAETRTEQLTHVWEAAARHDGREAFKVLLLARTAGEWWEDLQTSGLAQELLGAAVTTPLSPLQPDPKEWAETYRQAVAAFAERLPRVVGQERSDWRALASRLSAPAAHPGLGHALTLQMLALADLLDAADPVIADQSAAMLAPSVEDRLLAHEGSYWQRGANAPGLPRLESLKDVLAAVFLAGAGDREQADALLRRVIGTADPDRISATRTWIAGLYPGSGELPFGSLQPDRLAEQHVGRRLQKNPGLATTILPGATHTQLAQLVAVYARTTSHRTFQPLGAALTALCVSKPDVLASEAVQAVPQTENPQPLLAALHTIAESPDTSSELVEHLCDALPETSHRLGELSLQLTIRLVEHHRAQVAADTAQLPDLAMSLNNLAVRLGALGRREDGLAAIEEAVAAYRALAEGRPDAFLPDLAMSLNNLANRLGDLGRHEDGLAAIEEAVAAYRALAEGRPDAFLPDLAMSLNNLAVRLGALGRHEDGLAAIEEAVAVYRALAEGRPDAFLPDLAMSLNNLAVRLGDLGRREDGLAAIEEAVAVYRALAEGRPDAFLPDLAGSLNNLAIRLGDLGRREDGLAAVEEAVSISRTLAEGRPDAFLPDLAGSLNNLAVRLGALGWREDGLAAIEEAVAVYRALAEGRPDAFLPDLAMSLNNLAVRLGDLGRREDGLAAIEEAVGIRRTLAEGRPDAFLPDLATSLNNLANRLGDLGRREDGLAAIEEAVGIRRTLAEGRPDAFLPDLAGSLNNLAVRLGDLGRHEDGLAAIEEAVAVYRALAEGRPDAFLPDLAMSLNNLAVRLGDLGRHEDGLAAIEEAVAVYRALAEGRPDAFLPDLATSLNNLAVRLGDLGWREDGLAAVEEAVSISRTLAVSRPEVRGPELEQSLQVMEWLKSRSGDSG